MSDQLDADEHNDIRHADAEVPTLAPACCSA